MQTFFRADWDELYLRISSDEPLGKLDTAHKEDYFGEDGYLSLYHTESGQRFQIAMVEAPEYTPDIPRDNFIGYYPLEYLPDGTYQVQGRVRDELGNYTILSDFAEPFGDERVLALMFAIQPGFHLPCEIRFGGIILSGGMTLKQPFGNVLLAMPISDDGLHLKQGIACD